MWANLQSLCGKFNFPFSLHRNYIQDILHSSQFLLLQWYLFACTLSFHADASYNTCYQISLLSQNKMMYLISKYWTGTWVQCLPQKSPFSTIFHISRMYKALSTIYSLLTNFRFLNCIQVCCLYLQSREVSLTKHITLWKLTWNCFSLFIIWGTDQFYHHSVSYYF